MNEYKIKVNLERGLIINPDIHLVQNDYNSTTFNFEFDDDSYENYTKVFQLQYPDGTVWKKEIKDNKVTLANFDEEGNPVSILVQTGKYYFDIAVYDNDSKLTTTEKKYFNVREEITGEDIELDDRLPVLDDLINTVNKNLNETDNLNVDLKDNILTITKKDGTTYSENVKGEPGVQGKPGSVKIIPVTELPTENIEEDAIYLKPNPNPTSEKDKYQEFVYVNGDWELWGGGSVNVDLADYVKFTDYATSKKSGVVRTSPTFGIDINGEGQLFIVSAPPSHLEAKDGNYKPLVPSQIDTIVKNGLATNSLEWTNEEKTGARNVIGAVGKTDLATGTTPGLCTIAYNKWSSGLNINSSGMINISMAENNQIDDRSSKYQPIVPANLEYAVKSVVGGHITLTQAEYDALETKDENTYYYIVEE